MIDLDEGNLKQGLLGLVIALVEVIKDALATQAFKRVEGGSLSEAEIERLGEALTDLDIAMAQIKEEHGVAETVKNVRYGLDELVHNAVDRIVNPERWCEELESRKD
ncbi:MAG: gas vesicle protein K [Candidatus Omnitrophota bacterium]